jgi:hypothetical protein
MNKGGNFESIRPFMNKPGQPPANIPKEALHRKRFSLNHMLRRMLKEPPDKVFEYLGLPVPQRLTGEDKQAHKTILAALLAKAMAGKIDAINVVLERVEGKAVQPVDMNSGDGRGLVNAGDLPPELRVEILKQMLAEAEEEIKLNSEQEIKIVEAENEPGKSIEGNEPQAGADGDGGQIDGGDAEEGESVSKPEMQ